jgi:Zn-dependent peptidase ImmA (M78 family)/transcriptional regulator with XRE-family HTH domain
MTTGTAGFVKERLKQARESRALTLVAIADLIGVTSAAISHYEKGDHAPRHELLEKLAERLNLPASFFLKADPISRESARLFFRSMSSATKQARTRAVRRYEWLIEMVDYLGEYFDFPSANLPQFETPDDFRQIDSRMIEVLAQETRDHWQLGTGPIGDVIRTLESNGIIVTSGPLASEHLDAFSEYDDSGRPFVFLNSEKGIRVRSRFDCAHELGHLILHRRVDKKVLSRAVDFKLLEDQAHFFGSAFLMPTVQFTSELWAPTLDGFRALKSRWDVSIAAMIYRSKSLKLINEEETKRLWINLNRRGWREHEPLDDLPSEQPQVLSNCFKTLVDEGIKSKDQILADLRLSAKDIEELAGLSPGFISGDNGNYDSSPQLKKRRTGNVLEFRR